MIYLSIQNNSQAVYEISDTDSDDSGKETKSAKIKKEKKPPPVGGIPVLHAKKAKVAKVRLFILTLCFSSFTIFNRNLVHSSIKSFIFLLEGA